MFNFRERKWKLIGLPKINSFMKQPCKVFRFIQIYPKINKKCNYKCSLTIHHGLFIIKIKVFNYLFIRFIDFTFNIYIFKKIISWVSHL